MKKVFTVLFFVLVIGLASVFSWYYFGNHLSSNLTPSTNTNTPVMTTTSPVTTVGTAGLIVTAPAPNATVSSPLKVTGYVNGQDRWTGFEGQVGSVHLLDANGAELAFGPLPATTNWMQPVVNFETDLTFSAPTTVTGTLVFRNENASGMPEFEREFTMPVNFSVATSLQLQAYFSNSKLDPQINCEKVFPVARSVPQTVGVARAALEELLKGPTATETNAGYVTNINNNVQINNLSVNNGVATVDFNSAIETGVGGSCRVTAIRSQIVDTLNQFDTVRSVVISVNGRTEDVLQP